MTSTIWLFTYKCCTNIHNVIIHITGPVELWAGYHPYINSPTAPLGQLSSINGPVGRLSYMAAHRAGFHPLPAQRSCWAGPGPILPITAKSAKTAFLRCTYFSRNVTSITVCHHAFCIFYALGFLMSKIILTEILNFKPRFWPTTYIWLNHSSVSQTSTVKQIYIFVACI
jgi:hypothetical protein